MMYIGILIRMVFGKIATKARDHARRDDYYTQQIALLKGVAIGMGATCDDVFVVRKEGHAVRVEFAQSNDVIQAVTWRYIAPPPGLPRFRFKPDGRPKKQRSAVPWLDGAFQVTATDCVALTELWSPARCQKLLRLLGHADIECDGTQIVISLAPPRMFPTLIENGLELLFDIASADAYATKLVASLGTYHEEPLPFAVLPTPVDVRIGYARDSDRVFLQARVGIGALPDGAEQRFRALGATTFEALDGASSIISWPDVVRDRERLTDIAALLRSVATPSQGVFR